MLDVVIAGGTLVDGTGTPRRAADVAIRGGRVVGVHPPGTLAGERARRRIDASGLIVAPGFVDIHTHYDAQLFWDPMLSPSPLHGVTTVVGGNCGFTIAPLGPPHAEYLMRMLARVEGMPLESLERGVPWDWRTTAEYLDRVEKIGLAVNAGFLVGHSAIRRVAMGQGAVGCKASADEIGRMRQLLAEGLAAGALGFSSSWATTHNDGAGDPVPSRHASADELVALATVVRDYPGTTLEFIPTVNAFEPQHVELMTRMSLAANRPLNWNVLIVTAEGRAVVERKLSASDEARARGGSVLALTVPDVMRIRLSFANGFAFDAISDWAKTMALPHDEKLRALSDPAERARLRDTASASTSFRLITAWSEMTICEAFTAETKRHEGRKIGDIAAELGQDPFDTLCDIVVADDLRTGLIPKSAGDDDPSWQLRARIWRDPRVILGASDAGAHVDIVATFNYTTAFLGPNARDRRLMELEEAVRRLTDIPARLYGIRKRGRIAEGWCADVVIFDESRIGPGPVTMRHDLPAGAGRLYGEAEGIEHVLVNGIEIVRGKSFTGDRPGRLLRSGRDTETVTAGDRAAAN